MASNTTRRSTRISHSNAAKDATGLIAPSKTKKIADEVNKYFENDQLTEVLENIKIVRESDKPTELFSDKDVEGKDIYQLVKNPVKKNAMMQKAILSQNLASPSLSTKKVEKKVPILVIPKLKTGKLKSKCAVEQPKTKNKTSLKLFGDNPDFSDELEESFDEAKVTENSEHLENNIEKNENFNSIRVLRSKTREYYLKADEFFATQSGKFVTSNNTLSKLKNQHLDEDKLKKLLANGNHVSKVHQERIREMSEDLERQYPEWKHIMEEGFTVLLYGLGSKRLLINNFHKKQILDEPTLIINGFFPSLTIKEILDNIIIELLGLETNSNQSECFQIIEKTLKKHPDDRINLLIHNLDGGMLRSHKTQDILSRLASIPNIHVLASVDHINAPLIWDNVMKSRYNFYWIEATTFLRYEAETSYESSLLVQKNGALALLSLQNVFASLTTNAKSIYTILAKYQLKNDGNNYYGMAFKDLYQASREGFYVSSDQALRAQLTEFLDHKLVRTKRNYDGVESLIIPLDNALLKQFLEQYEET